MRKNLTLILNRFEREDIGKDIFFVAYLLGKKLQYSVTLVYPHSKDNTDFPEYLHGVHLVPLKLRGSESSFSFYRLLPMYWYLLQHACSITILMRFHATLHTKLMAILYKGLHRSGRVYVKLDINADNIGEDSLFEKKSRLKRVFNMWAMKYFVKSVDVLSCETKIAYEKLKGSSLLENNFGEKLYWMPNGFDEELLLSYKMKEKSFSEKENLIITVGRLGTYPKNTEMFLRALEKTDLKDWKVLLIGPVEDAFKNCIVSFLKRNPGKDSSVRFVGLIQNKNDLWEYYNKAKVFVLTSRFESYGLVLNEAKRFSNYLVSTGVGGFYDLSENGKYGCEVPHEDSDALSDILNDIVSGRKDINVYHSYDMKQLSWDSMIEKLPISKLVCYEDFI